MAVNVRGVYLCSKHAIPAMAKNGGGAIVNTASVVAAVGIRNRAAYCASKGAVAALTRAMAIDHVGAGIRCNAIAPGTIDTPYFNDILKASADPPATRKALAARQLLGRLGTPEEIAAGILFLASDESRFATGTILTLDGGMTAQWRRTPSPPITGSLYGIPFMWARMAFATAAIALVRLATASGPEIN